MANPEYDRRHPDERAARHGEDAGWPAAAARRRGARRQHARRRTGHHALTRETGDRRDAPTPPSLRAAKSEALPAWLDDATLGRRAPAGARAARALAGLPRAVARAADSTWRARWSAWPRTWQTRRAWRSRNYDGPVLAKRRCACRAPGRCGRCRQGAKPPTRSARSPAPTSRPARCAQGARQFKKLVGSVDFPQFVGGLIQNVFQAIVNASIQQMNAYGRDAEIGRADGRPVRAGQHHDEQRARLAGRQLLRASSASTRVRPPARAVRRRSR